MYSNSRTISTLLGLNSYRLQVWKHLLPTVIFIVTLLMPNLECSPVPELCSSTMLVSDQPFSKYVRNPCEGRELYVSSLTDEEKVTHRGLLFNRTVEGDNLPTIINTYKKTADKILSENMNMRACQHHNLQDTSNIDSIEGKPEQEGLLHTYSLLLKHLSDVHHIRDQDVKYSDITCSEHRPSHSTFPENTKKLSSGLQEITCMLQMAISTYSVQDSEFSDRSENVLGSTVCDNEDCSQRLLDDCLTLKSTSYLLAAFDSYLQRIQPGT